MLDGLKKKIQDSKIENLRELARQKEEYVKDRYERWLNDNEASWFVTYNAAADLSGVKVIDIKEPSGMYPFSAYSSYEILIFVDYSRGVPREGFEAVICNAFSMHEEWDILYADEDFMQGGKRYSHFMKPDYSPDTLLAFNYFGSLVAVRRSRFATVEWLEKGTAAERMYDFVLKCSEKVLAGAASGVGHLQLILFHNMLTDEEGEAYRKLLDDTFLIENPKDITWDENLPWYNRLYADNASFDRVRLSSAERLSGQARIECDSYGIRHIVYEPSSNPLVSIIIPSKDNVEVLERLLLSIDEHKAYRNYEIIVVDNGSSGAARTRLMNFARTRVEFKYLYNHMDFNFSAMVNYGVRNSKGEFILLLNDDTEVTSDDWLLKMVGNLSLSHVGAVGAKLLYPGGQLIQHTGVTNLAVGPAHKLQGKDDGNSYYFGRNRRDYNYIGVTAACLLTKKELWDKVGGFDENIRVAFNDVDFCFKLHEAGYFSVMRCDVVLYHYESLSRGNDLLDEDKKKRMLSERDKLYEKHPQLWGKDPFYSPNLMGNAVDYIIEYHFDYELETFYTDIAPFTEVIRPEWYNDSVFVTVEKCCISQALMTRNVEDAYNISGWCYVLSMDNCRYEMSLLLEKDDKYLEVKVNRDFRPDVVQILPDEKDVEFAGFLGRVRKSALPEGEYKVYAYLKDLCSRQRLLKDTGAILKAI